MDRAFVAAVVCVAILVGCDGSDGPNDPPVEDPTCLAAPEGLVHWWPGDGSGADLVGGLDATPLNGATFAPGFVRSGGGMAFSFDGVDAVAHVPPANDLNVDGTFSVMAWARPGPQPTPNGAVVGKGDPWQESYVLDHHQDRWRGVVRIDAGFDVRLMGPPVGPGEWTHLALTWDSQQLVFYVDGLVEGSAPVASILASTGFLGIGARSEAGFTDAELDLEFAGDVEEVALFERALTPAEVASIVEAGDSGMCKP